MRRTPFILFASAGVCWTAGQAVIPDVGLTTAERYDAVSGSRAAESASAALLVGAGILLVLAAFMTARHTAPLGGRGARLVTVGAALTGLGGVWLAAGRGAFNLFFLRLLGDGVPRDVALRILDDAGSPAFLVLVLTLPCLLIGPLLLALGLRRARHAGWLPVACWVLGIGTFIATEFSFKLGEIAGIGLGSLGLALMGFAIGGETTTGNADDSEVTARSRVMNR